MNAQTRRSFMRFTKHPFGSDLRMKETKPKGLMSLPARFPRSSQI